MDIDPEAGGGKNSNEMAAAGPLLDERTKPYKPYNPEAGGGSLQTDHNVLAITDPGLNVGQNVQAAILDGQTSVIDGQSYIYGKNGPEKTENSFDKNTLVVRERET